MELRVGRSDLSHAERSPVPQPRDYIVDGVARTVLQEEHYEETKMRVVDVPVTVTEQGGAE